MKSQALDLLRFPLAVIIVADHVFNSSAITEMGGNISIDNFVIFKWVLRFVDGFMRYQSVPIYYFISGFVFFLGVKEFTESVYFKKLKNRFHSLFIPYIIWNTVALLMLVLFSMPMFSSLYSNGEFMPSLHGFLSCYWAFDKSYLFKTASLGITSPVNVPLWFLRNLMIVVLCTPILYKLLKWFKYYFVIAVGLLWIGNAFLDFDPMDFTSSFFFFSWGAYMSISSKDMIKYFGRFFSASMILYPVLSISYMVMMHFAPQYAFIVKQANIIAGLLFAYNSAVWLLKNNRCKVNQFLASSSFFIYVTHILICSKLLKIMLYILKPQTDMTILAVYVAALLFTLAILLTTFWFMKRYTPNLLRVVTGRK